MSKFFIYARNIFILLIILQIAPFLLKAIHNEYKSYFETSTKVGSISIKGPFYNSRPFTLEIEKFFKDEAIKAIILEVECAEGSLSAAQSLFNEIKEMKKNVSPKFVLALIENIAIGAGYYAACSADYIVASPAAIIGGIDGYTAYTSGKIQESPIENATDEKLAKKIGSKREFKELVLASFDMDNIKSINENISEQFVKDVIESRTKAKLSVNLNEWARGKIFTGEQALKLGLVDKLGSLSTAEEALKDNAPVIGKIKLIKPKESIITRLMKMKSNQPQISSGMSPISKILGAIF